MIATLKRRDLITLLGGAAVVAIHRICLGSSLRRVCLPETDCVAGHVRLELKNVGASYPF
jgi:hypothetical protein